MGKREAIKIEYPGSVISVNHYLGRRRGGGSYIQPEAKAWSTEFQWLLKRMHIEDWRLPLEVTCSGYFTSEHRACDLSNLSKLILDSIEECTGVNDKQMRWHDGVRDINPKNDPHLLIVISEPVIDNPEPPIEPPPDVTKSKSKAIVVKRQGIHHKRGK